MFNEIKSIIEKYETIIIHRHLRPDGDCIGSQFGLKQILLDNYPNKSIYCVGDEIPEYLSFIGKNDIISDDIYKNALAIVVDTSVDHRICDNRYLTAEYIIKIDHHDDSPDFGNLCYVDPKSPACCQLITQFASETGLNITKEAAKALYTGIVTDTGRFQFRGLSKKTFEMAGLLIDTGLDTEEIYAELNLKDLESYKLQAYVYKNIKRTPNGVAYIYFTNKIIKKFGVTREDAAALVSSLSSIKGSMFWITFVDYPENIRVRLRSRFMAINELGKKYRGGGHLQAAGATIYNKKEMKQLLKEADDLIKEFKMNHPEAK